MTTSAHHPSEVSETPEIPAIPAPRAPVEQACPRCHRRVEVVLDPAAVATSPQTDGWVFVEHAHHQLRFRRRPLRCRASGHNRWAAEHGW